MAIRPSMWCHTIPSQPDSPAARTRSFGLITTATHDYLTAFGLSHNCDNTLAAADAQAEARGNRVSIRHTVGSLDRAEDVQEALGLLVKATDAYAAQIDALAMQRVSPAQFESFLKQWAPEASDSKQAKTMASNKRAELASLYLTDERVTPWTGTAFGVLQAVNTHRHHVKRVVGDTRYGRNMHDFIKGTTGKQDAQTLKILASVL